MSAAQLTGSIGIGTVGGVPTRRDQVLAATVDVPAEAPAAPGRAAVAA